VTLEPGQPVPPTRRLTVGSEWQFESHLPPRSVRLSTVLCGRTSKKTGSQTMIDIQVLKAPLPCTRGRGVGVRGAERLHAPAPSPPTPLPEYGGEGSKACPR